MTTLAPPLDLSGPPPVLEAERNDACPCGSGEKFKRCCLARRVSMQTNEDCVRAAMASLAAVPIGTMPDVELGGERRTAFESWARDRGLVMEIHTRDAFPLDGFWALLVKAPTGIGHAVLMRDDRLYHDPIPYRHSAHNELLAAAEPHLGVTLRDPFNLARGDLTGEVAPDGGTWSEAGDLVGFVQDTTNLWTVRTENSDADVVTGHYARLGTANVAAVEVQADIKATLAVLSGEKRLGVFARYVDTSNWLMAVMVSQLTARVLALYKRVAGTTTLLGSGFLGAVNQSYDWRTIKLTADAAGNVNVYEGAQGADLGSPKITVLADANLATGGALDDGGYGIYDACTSTSGTNTRRVDNFQVLTPPASAEDAAIFASQSLEIRHDRIIREDSGGTLWVTPSRVESDYLLVPPAGREGRQVRWIVKASRGDPASMADGGIDDISARLSYTPRYLVVPEP